MLGFNYLLGGAGVQLDRAILVRHQDNRAPAGRRPHDLWVAGDGRFEEYQSFQTQPRFEKGDWIASFVATPLDETVFVGLYRVSDVGTAPMGATCPVTGRDVTGSYHFALTQEEGLKAQSGCIVIDWGKGYRAWIQRADRQDKPVLEIRRQAIEPPFPGFLAFSWPVRDLSAVPPSWRAALSAVSGVYLLVCRRTGQQYIGSAYGGGGFWSRWEEYFRTGHGSNVAMKPLVNPDFTVSILECAFSGAEPEEIIRLEARWKDKLLSRSFGLNRN